MDAAKQQQAPGQREALLQEFRGLQDAFPDNGAVREPFAKALYNTINATKPGRRDAFLEELPGRQERYGDDGTVRGNLARAL